MSNFSPRKTVKRMVFAVSLVCVSPFTLTAWIEKKISKSEMFFVGLGQFFCIFPGIIGSYLRVAYYFSTLERCSWEVHIGFGSYFSHRTASLGKRVSMGSYCVIGMVSIDDDVVMASRISITSGKRQHFDDSGKFSPTPILERVHIGRKTWIGEGAIILANVGDYCVVSAGAVVTKDVADGLLLAGNPGKPIRELRL